MVDRAQLLPVAHRARRDVRRLRLRRLLDRHRHAGEVHAGAPRHHGRPLSRRAPFARRRRRARGSRPTRGSKTARRSKGPASSTRARSSRPGAQIGPYTVLGRQTQIEEDAVVERRDRLAELPHRPARRAFATPILGRHCHVGRNVQRQRRRGARRQDDADRLHDERMTSVTVTVWDRGQMRNATSIPTSSRPTTSAASIPARSTKTSARQIGRGFVAYLGAEAHRRVARHARLVAGARRRVHRRRARSRAPTSSTTA